MDNRLEREKVFHDNRFYNDSDVREAVNKYYSIHHIVTILNKT